MAKKTVSKQPPGALTTPLALVALIAAGAYGLFLELITTSTDPQPVNLHVTVVIVGGAP
jgi:hypothetical protein